MEEVGEGFGDAGSVVDDDRAVGAERSHGQRHCHAMVMG